jgi:hypothetical protein
VISRGVAAELVRRAAGAAWRFRCGVEQDAAARFARLAGRLAAVGAQGVVVDLAERASRDERRHAVLCAELAMRYGAPAPAAGPASPPEIAPAGLAPEQRVLYEVVAACCVTETESMGVLTHLLAVARDAGLRDVLRELARDEVRHSQLGWAHLAAESARGDVSFLGPFVPAMLRGAAGPDLFAAAGAEHEDATLLEHGVLPHAAKRQLFTRTLDEVVFPGLQAYGIDTAPARRWLEDARKRSREPPT